MLSSVGLPLAGQVGLAEAALWEILETPLKYICHLLVQLFLKPTVAVVEDWVVMEQLLAAAEAEEREPQVLPVLPLQGLVATPTSKAPPKEIH